MRVVPSREGSYERIFHDAHVPAFALHLRRPSRRALRDELTPQLLERAIGVVYRPKTELLSHYFYARLPHQFDEYVWFDETQAVHPLPEVPTRRPAEVPDTYPTSRTEPTTRFQRSPIAGVGPPPNHRWHFPQVASVAP
jgi:erythromycin esterase